MSTDVISVREHNIENRNLWQVTAIFSNLVNKDAYVYAPSNITINGNLKMPLVKKWSCN